MTAVSATLLLSGYVLATARSEHEQHRGVFVISLNTCAMCETYSFLGGFWVLSRHGGDKKGKKNTTFSLSEPMILSYHCISNTA